MTNRALLRPVLDGDSWLIGPSPSLTGLLPDPPSGARPHECVDHHVFRSADGAWHLWGCIRGTSVGRILYHWEGETLAQAPWRCTDELLRVDHAAGESLDDRYGQEWLQSPFVVHDDGTYYMFYGGHSTAQDRRGCPVPGDDPAVACQMCLMASPDGRTWTRYQDERGYSRLFVGPGETRDPCLLKLDCSASVGPWLLFYAGYHNDDPQEAGFYVRTSSDLVHWSDWRLVHQDRHYGPGRWDTECPHVVCREGMFYLFRTEDYASAKTHVFCSDDPFDFGVGDAASKYVGTIAVAAPEIILDTDGQEYVTSNHDLRGGTRLSRLRWERA